MSTTITPGAGNAAVPAPRKTFDLGRAIHAPAVARPPAVEKAAAARGKVAERFEAARARWKAARDGVAEADAEDIREDALRVLDGKPQLKPSERRLPKAEAELQEAVRERSVVANADVAAYEELEKAVRENRDAWLVDVTAARDTARKDLLDALAAADEAARRFGQALSAHNWLEAVTGRVIPMGVAGSRFDAPVPSSYGGQAVDLIAVVRKAAQGG